MFTSDELFDGAETPKPTGEGRKRKPRTPKSADAEPNANPEPSTTPEPIDEPTPSAEPTEPSADPFDAVDLAGAESPTSTPPDPFDPAALRLTQDFAEIVGGEKLLVTVPVRKPAKEWWVRVHPGLPERDGKLDYRIDTLVIELKEDSETYLLAPALRPLVAGEPTVRMVSLYTSITRNGDVFLWPIPLPGTDGKDNEWYRSAREAAKVATSQWARVTSNRSLGAYETSIMRAEIPEPIWPKQSFRDLLQIAFRDRFIQEANHPVLLRLRGEA